MVLISAVLQASAVMQERRSPQAGNEVLCAAVRGNIHAHVTITLAVLADLVYGNRSASGVISRHAEALRVADELLLWTYLKVRAERRDATPLPREFRSAKEQWDLGAAPSELQIAGLVFFGLGFRESDAAEYMLNRPLPVRIRDRRPTLRYVGRVEAARSAFLRFERRVVEEDCPRLRTCLQKSIELQQPYRLEASGPAPTDGPSLNRHLKQLRPILRTTADVIDEPKVALLRKFWDQPTSDAVWEEC